MRLDQWKTRAKAFKRELNVYQLVLKDRRTPTLAKFFLWLTVGYALMPFDLIPDFIPVVGHLDDVVIIPALLFVALAMIPRAVVEDCRARLDEQRST